MEQERDFVDITGNKNLIRREKKLERSHFRVSSQEFCFILFFFLFFPIILFVSELLSCSCKYKGEKGRSLRKVFYGVTVGERVGRNLRGNFIGVIWIFVPAFLVALKNFSGTIFTQCPNPFKLSSRRLSRQFYISNFLNFSFSLFLINFPLSNGQRVEYRSPSTFLHSFHSRQISDSVLSYNFQMLFRATWRVRQVRRKGLP